ncbi:MAG: response regulator transcription factor [Gemmataceae bacterium]
MKSLRLMLIDDHAVVRAGLKALFDRQPEMTVVADADSTRDAIATIESQHPHVLVLDLTLPSGGSLDLIRDLRSREGTPRVVVLTMHDDPAYARSALMAGASGYMVKTVGEQELLDAVRGVSRGQVVIDLDDPEKTAAVYRRIGRPGTATGLSERELEVLALLGRGFSNQEVAEQIDISPKTVATYRARIAEKIGLKSTADFVRYAADNGLLGPSPK